jgi:hypothetical protein
VTRAFSPLPSLCRDVSLGFFFIERARYGRKIQCLSWIKDRIVMRQYLVDELRPIDFEKLEAYMDKYHGPCQVKGLYWVALEEDLLDDVQKVHKDCRPFCFAVELRPTAIVFELLIRTRNRMRCDCIRYANSAQRERIFQFADSIFKTVKILT